MALVVVMLVTLVCFGVVMTSAAEKTLDVEINDLKFVGITQDPNNPFLLKKEYGEAWDIEWADGADIGIDPADAGKISFEIHATLDNENVGMRTITVTYTAVTNDNALKAKYGVPSAQTYAVEIVPKQLTWVGGNANVSFTYGDTSVEISNSKLSNMPTLSGCLAGDNNVTPIISTIVSGDKVSTATAGKHTAWTTVKVASSNPNYTIADLVIDANVQKLLISSTDIGEKTFTWGDTVVIDAYGTDEKGNVHKLVVQYDAAAAAGDVGTYVFTVVSPDANNIAFANGVAVSAAYRITPKTFVVSFPDRSVIGDRNNVFHPAVAGDIPADILAGVVYTVGGEAFSGTATYGVYSVKAELPTSANYVFKNAKGDTVTTLTATLTVRSQELIAAGSEGKPYQIVLYSENGYVGNYTASVTIPELARKTMRGLPHYAGYTLKINGADSETFTAVIPIDASLYQKGCEKLTINDIYVYETATDEMVVANGHNGYIVLIKDNCYYISGLSGNASVTFVVAPQYSASFWLTAPGIAVIALIVLALLILMIIIGMYLRRAEAKENEELVLVEGEAPEFASVEEDVAMVTEEEKLDAMAEAIAAEPTTEEPAEVEGVAEAVEEAKAELMSELEDVKGDDDAVPTVAVVEPEAEPEAEVETEDDDEDEDFGGFNTADLDFFDAAEEPERYAALLAQEAAGEIRIITRYRRSFQSKLAQSQGNVSEYYNAIKNALLSYKGIKNRISWNYEAFNRGRVHVAKIIAKTKTLYVYLAIDPATLEDSKYTFVDVSSKKKYASVPVLMKVKGERKFKHVLELIDKIGTESLNLPKLEREDVDYRIPYASTEDLVAQGLVKKMVAALPIVAQAAEETAVEEATEATTPAAEEQTVTFVAPSDTPAVEAAAEEIASEEAATESEEIPAVAETAEDTNTEA